MKFWPIFDIFHWLRPYLCSKGYELGFHKQATHRRRSEEPFFAFGSTVHNGCVAFATRAFATPIFVASATPIFVASATPYFRISATQTAATPKILF